MTVALTIVGLLLGAATVENAGGFLFGGLVGYLLGALRAANARLRAVESELGAVKSQLAFESTTPARLQAPSGALAVPQSQVEAEPAPGGASKTIPEDDAVAPITDDTRASWEPYQLNTDAPMAGEQTPPPSASLSVASSTTATETEPETAPKYGHFREPEAPGLFDRAFTAARNWLFGGNTVVRVGIVVFTVGVGLLAKYAVDHSVFPVEVRLIFTSLMGIALLVVGWRVRHTRAGYGTTLQGGGVGALYITVFFALKSYNLIAPELAFPLLVLLAVYSGIIAVLQDSVSLAVMGALGGFLAPVLASTGQGNHVVLFSYYALLNAGIFGIAWFKAWRSLNLLGFACTFGVGSAWGALKYEPGLFGTTEPFLLLFFVFYVGIAVLHAWKQAPKLRGFVDGSLVFGTPLVVSMLQTALVEDFEMGLAFSAFGFGAFYLVLATLLFKVAPQTMRHLVEAFLALGVGFATLAIPFALDDQQITATTWALEGAGLVWLGVKQQRLLSRLAGYGLQIAAGVAFGVASYGMLDGSIPVVNAAFMGCATIAVTGVFVNYVVWRGREALSGLEVALNHVFLVWGLLWWVGGVINEIEEFAPHAYGVNAAILSVGVSALVLELLGKRLAWCGARYAATAVWPGAWLFAAVAAESYRHPFESGGFIVWAAMIGLFYFLLRRHEITEKRSALRAGHVFALWLAAALLVWEVVWGIQEFGASGVAWKPAAFGVSMAVFLTIVIRRSSGKGWPMGAHSETYLVFGAGGIAAVTSLWVFGACFENNGDPWPLPYIPLANPIELATGLALVVLARWLWTIKRANYAYVTPRASRIAVWVLSGLGFLWLNGVLVRIVHHFAHVRFDGRAMYESPVLQTSISIFWTFLALVIMVLATRKRARAVWITAACLLGAVVVKLFVIDLAKLSMVAKIVSFLGVGLLLVLIGYLSPVPPSREAPKGEST